MHADEVSRTVDAAVRVATQDQKTEFDRKIDELTKKLTYLASRRIGVQTYQE